MVHGGYINLLAGQIKFNLIYFGSGIFGNMLSIIYRQNVVVCGSSGSILGMLMAWLVWILLRWEIVPQNFRWMRNIQIIFIVLSVGSTVSSILYQLSGI